MFLSMTSVISAPFKVLSQQARQIWVEVYILWFSVVGQVVGAATPYWSITTSGYSGLWEFCLNDACTGVFEYGDPQHWLRCVQIVICLSIPLTMLSAVFMILASTKTNTNCSTPAGFASLTAGCMSLLGCGFYGYQQSQASTIGWSLILSVVSGSLCVLSTTRMFVNCLKPDTGDYDNVQIYQEGPVNL